MMETSPPGEDPATLVRQGGAAALQPLLRDAMDVLERKLQLLDQRGWFGDVARRRDALDRILPTLEAASDPIVRDLYLGRVVEKVGVGRETRSVNSGNGAPDRSGRRQLPSRAPSPDSPPGPGRPGASGIPARGRS